MERLGFRHVTFGTIYAFGGRYFVILSHSAFYCRAPFFFLVLFLKVCFRSTPSSRSGATALYWECFHIFLATNKEWSLVGFHIWRGRSVYLIQTFHALVPIRSNSVCVTSSYVNLLEQRKVTLTPTELAWCTVSLFLVHQYCCHDVI